MTSVLNFDRSRLCVTRFFVTIADYFLFDITTVQYRRRVNVGEWRWSGGGFHSAGDFFVFSNWKSSREKMSDRRAIRNASKYVSGGEGKLLISPCPAPTLYGLKTKNAL